MEMNAKKPLRRSMTTAAISILTIHVAPIDPDFPIGKVLDRFTADANLVAVPVVAAGVPIGIVCRRNIVESFARPYTRELLGRKPVSAFMRTDPLLVDGRTDIDEVNNAVVKSDAMRTFDSFIVTEDDRYVGIVLVRDLSRAITERNQARLYRLAYFDNLTGLPNRAFFIDSLHEARERARRQGRFLAVMLLDIDRFKAINDSLGHFVADELLVAVGERLSACVRGGDLIARLGGDEFTVILSNLTDWRDAGAVATKITARFAGPFLVRGHELFVNLSIGIAIDAERDDAMAILREADTAMYTAKAQGGGRFEFYSPELGQTSTERLALENDLRRAVERKELRLHYQPRVDIATRAVVGAEALVRWQHPERGLIPPGDFIPLAEETGLIVAIGEWVLQQVCVDLAECRRAGKGPVRVGINVSARQFFNSDFVRRVRETLARTGTAPRMIQIELTENILIENRVVTVDMLNELHNAGIELSLDDFGTGYSSLSYLKRFPIDEVKIDRSFVCDVTANPESKAIVTAILAMARTLDIRTVAEGVEHEQELSFLRAHGCHEVQGYLTGRPMALDRFMQTLRVETGGGLIAEPMAAPTTSRPGCS